MIDPKNLEHLRDLLRFRRIYEAKSDLENLGLSIRIIEDWEHPEMSWNHTLYVRDLNRVNVIEMHDRVLDIIGIG